jgi:GNAT superfamily N-acetyltransferase
MNIIDYCIITAGLIDIYKTDDKDSIKDFEEAYQKHFNVKIFPKGDKYVYYGIYYRDYTAGFAIINTDPNPVNDYTADIAINTILIYPNYKGKGLATLCYKYFRKKYNSILSGMGSKSNLKAMKKLHEKLGFKCIFEKGKTKLYYYEKG